MRRESSRAGIAGWMLFDWAAQPFFTVVITFVFGPYFVSHLADDPARGQAWWGYTITAGGIVVAVVSPVLGAVADAAGPRKPWIVAFAAVKITALCLLWWASPGSPLIYASVLVVLASVAAEFSIVFNDSMMPRLVDRADAGRISNLAWGLGYAGGMVFLVGVLVFLAGDATTGNTVAGLTPLFGLDPASFEGARVTAPLAALWYAVFLMPMLLLTPDGARAMALRPAIAAGLSDLGRTLAQARGRGGIMRFLIARMIYQDGVNGLIALGGSFAAGMFAWQTVEIGLYGIILIVVAIAGCAIASRLDSRLGSKRVVMGCLVCLVAATAGIVSTGPGYTLFGLVALPDIDGGGLFATSAEKAFIGFGALIGLAFGPVQASSRSFLARSVAADEAGRYFGLYALAGRATSFVAPFAVATVTVWTGSARAGMATLIVFLLAGMALLARTPYPAGSADDGAHSA